MDEAKEVAGFARALTRAPQVDRGGREALARVRDKNLGRVLDAASRAPLYRDQLTRQAVRDLRLDAVRPLAKDEFLGRLEDTLSDAVIPRSKLDGWVRDPTRAGQLLDGRFIVAMTSGTSGQVGVFLNDVGSWARTRGLMFGRIFRDRLRPREIARVLRERRYRMAFVVATGGHFMTSLIAQRMPKVGRLFADARTLSIETPLPAIVSRLNELRPHLLHSYPTVLELLANEAKAGRLVARPEMLTAGSEPVTASCRAALKEAFPDATLVETYAATECVAMATACPRGHLHVNEDACILEPVDDNLQPVAPGARGSKVLVTNLLNTAQPLLRYVLTDSVQLEPGGCACGSPFKRLHVHGRSDDTFFLEDPEGSFQAHPPIPLEVIFLSVPGLLQYQLIHETQNHLRVLFTTERTARGDRVAGIVDDQLSRYLEDHGLLSSVSFTLEEVPALTRPAQGRKIRQILSKVAPPVAGAQSAAVLRERRRRPRAHPPLERRSP